MQDMVTVIRSIKPDRVCKTYRLTDGILDKTAVAHMSKGEATTLGIDSMQDLAAVLETVSSRSDIALCTGSWHGAVVGEPFNVVTKKALAQMLDVDEVDAPCGIVTHNGEKIAARLKCGIKQSAYILLDADNPPGIPSDWAAMTIAERLELLEPILPGISQAERLELRASSARVVKDGQKPGHATHAYIKITNPELLPMLKLHVQVKMSLHDLSFPVDRHSRTDGAVIGCEHRTVIDLAVWHTGRLIFCAQPDVMNAPGYYVADANVTIVNQGAGAFDNSAYDTMPPKADVDRMNKKDGTQKSFKADGNSYAVQDVGTLKLSTPIEVRGVTKPLSEWVNSVPKDGKLRCESPFRDSSSEAAFIALTRAGKPFVYDTGCNTTYMLSGVDLNLTHNLDCEVEQVVRNERGSPVWCYQTAYAILSSHADWQGVVAYDELAGVVMLTKPIPGTRTPKSSFTPREFADVDTSHATRWFNKNGFPKATTKAVADALVAAAHDSVISPVRHYLEDLVWDGMQRVDHLFVDYFGAEDTVFNRAVGRAWAISAVARALRPGCKADHAPVLEGAQGAGKSTAMRVLAGDAWFHDGLGDLGSKDASAALRGKWIIELPELAAMRRTDVEATKAFLSRTTERYRPAYGRAEVVEPRRCVFIGTTNRQDWLTDDTGGRRFWPVVVGNIQLAALKRDRDQLWAEAVALYRSGEKWWLDGEAEREASALVMDRSADDPWTSLVLDYADNHEEVSTKQILRDIGIDSTQQTVRDSMRVAGILTRGGWTKIGRFTSGPYRNQSRYVRGVK